MDCTSNTQGRILYVVLLGQLASFAFALLRICSSLSTNLGVHAPITLSFFSYLTITWVYGCVLLYRRQKLLISWYWYVLLALVDVQGNYLVSKTHQLSSITNVTVLDYWMVVCVIIFTWRFLGTKYSDWQFVGVAGCVIGLSLAPLSRMAVVGGWNPVLGDVLVIAGSCFFVLSNIGEEFCVKKGSRIEVITMLALFGMIMSLIEMTIFEKKNLELVSWSPQVILTFIGYTIAGFTFYTLTPLVLQASGATLFIMSLFTTHMWEMVIRAFIYEQKVGLEYYVSLLVVCISLIQYYEAEMWRLFDDNEDTHQPYQLLPKEVV